MKKAMALLLSLLLLCIVSVPVFAATEPIITQQPHSMNFPEGARAQYSVTVWGQNLTCKWMLHFNGDDYELCDSETSDGSKWPWEWYAGETYGAYQTEKEGGATTFTYFFEGISSELNGCYIYAVIEDGHYQLTSSRAYIDITKDQSSPPQITVPASMEVYKGDMLDLYCSAIATDGGQLSYLWYETATGDLKDIIAINRGAETYDTLRCDTSEVGTRYYVCGVNSSFGGNGYSGVIRVTVLDTEAAGDPPQITTKTLPEATVGQKYNTKLACTDAKAEFVIYENPGKANDFDKTGLQLSESGVLSGTPTKAGTYTFTVCAVGDNGEGYMMYTLTVKNAPAESSKVEESSEPEASEEQNPEEESNTTIGEENDPVAPAEFPWWTLALAVPVVGGAAAGTVFFVRKKK